jgi:hypothetical protein
MKVSGGGRLTGVPVRCGESTARISCPKRPDFTDRKPRSIAEEERRLEQGLWADVESMALQRTLSRFLKSILSKPPN